MQIYTHSHGHRLAIHRYVDMHICTHQTHSTGLPHEPFPQDTASYEGDRNLGVPLLEAAHPQ